MEGAAKAVLLALTLVLMASMGGGFLVLPVLIPAHVWAARRSGRAGRVAWSLLPGASVAMVVWAAVYVVFGETKPAIWLLPLLAFIVVVMLVVRVAARPSAALPP